MNRVDRTVTQIAVSLTVLAKRRYRCRKCGKKIKVPAWHSAGHVIEGWESEHSGHADRG